MKVILLDYVYKHGVAGEVIEVVQQAIIDVALQEPLVEAAPGPVVQPASPERGDDFSLNIDPIAPIDSQEALEILSSGGEIPEVLRKRLQKRQSKAPDDL